MIVFSMIKIVYKNSPEAKVARQTIRTSARIVFFISILIFTDTPVKVNSPFIYAILAQIFTNEGFQLFPPQQNANEFFEGRGLSL